MELLVRLQVYRSGHRDLSIDDVRDKVLDDFVASVDETLLQVHEVKEEHVEACW